MASPLKDYRLKDFYEQHRASKAKTQKRKQMFFAALELTLITLTIGGLICLIKIFS